MIKAYEIDFRSDFSDKENNVEVGINNLINKEDINIEDIISVSWKKPGILNIFVKY